MIDITYLYMLSLVIKMFAGVWVGFVMLSAVCGITWMTYKIIFSFIFGGTPNAIDRQRLLQGSSSGHRG